MSRQPSSRAKLYWRRFGQSYGARMADQYGATCPPDWAEIIDRTDDERLNKAMMVIRREYLQYPPTLGQFEAAIPKRNLTSSRDSIIDRLAVHAVKTFPMCEHQLSKPWSYFGTKVDTGGRDLELRTHGVTIVACDDENCLRYGKSYRLLESELP